MSADLTVQELAAARLDAEARELAEAYIAAGVITATMRADAQHLALPPWPALMCW